jgi:hypothetical protein
LLTEKTPNSLEFIKDVKSSRDFFVFFKNIENAHGFVFQYTK